MIPDWLLATIFLGGLYVLPCVVIGLYVADCERIVRECRAILNDKKARDE